MSDITHEQREFAQLLMGHFDRESFTTPEAKSVECINGEGLEERLKENPLVKRVRGGWRVE